MKYLHPLQLKWSTSFTTSSKESPLKTPWSVSLFSGNRTIPLTIFLPIDRLNVCQLWRWLILFSEFPSLIVVTTRAKFSLFREKKLINYLTIFTLHIPPRSTPIPHSIPIFLSLFKTHATKSNYCCLYTLPCVAMVWSMIIFSGATFLENRLFSN